MSTRTSRSEAIDAVRTNVAPPSIFPSDEAPGEVFGANVFSKSVMKQRLPKAIFASLMATIDHGETLDASVAGVIHDEVCNVSSGSLAKTPQLESFEDRKHAWRTVR
jgi:glutamine synthetase type III